VWVPDDAEFAEGDGYTIVRLPDYFDWDPHPGRAGGGDRRS